ncbi:MAG: hypothetical protein FWD17_19320 [Polyangiaceae bacterium]|nr:hypothetical protein [Polyangiaceae bacterium]
MPVPFPSTREVLTTRPDAEQASFIARGLVSAIAPASGLTPLQAELVEGFCESMTDHPVDAAAVAASPIGPTEFAEGLARRNEIFRTRIVHLMLIGMLVLVPLPADVVDRVSQFAAELGIDDGIDDGGGMLSVAKDFAAGSLGLALIDFQRNGYDQLWSPADAGPLHTSVALDEAWDLDVDDPALVARWAALEECPSGSLGHRVFEFYRARGFTFPGLAGSAPPLLAQHDWVHVLADFGTTVESELEVFTFIARANADPRAFSLVALVVSLFETGYLSRGAGLFEYDRGHLERPGMGKRMGDAMRRGADTVGEPDFLRIDWFEYADLPVDEVRRRFGIRPKSQAALQSGSVGPWEPGGISPFQAEAGRRAADVAGRRYDSFGATPVN